MNNIVSPIRYMGGKSRACKRISWIMPPSDTVLSPFFGGGSVELHHSGRRGSIIFGYDKCRPLTNFWKHAISNNQDLVNKVATWRKLTKGDFYELRDNTYYEYDPDSVEAAAAYFVLNRCSWAGVTLMAGASPGFPRFTDNSILRLKHIKLDRIRMENADFEVSLANHPNMFAYLDPPYVDAGRLYASMTTDTFEHERLADALRGRRNWLLSYNNHPQIEQLYEGHTALELTWRYGNGKMGNELLILSLVYPRPIPILCKEMLDNYGVTSKVLHG